MSDPGANGGGKAKNAKNRGGGKKKNKKNKKTQEGGGGGGGGTNNNNNNSNKNNASGKKKKNKGKKKKKKNDNGGQRVTQRASSSVLRPLRGKAAAKFEETLDDLCTRFIINLPAEELASFERILMSVEEAHWFYDDFYCDRLPKGALPRIANLKTFARCMFEHCPLLQPHVADFDTIYDAFAQYKSQIPVRGGILLNATMDKVLLVRGWKKKAGWTFPGGKINHNETDLACALREVFEETGFDMSPHICSRHYLEAPIRSKNYRHYVAISVEEEIAFSTRTRKEIGDIAFHPISSLPTDRRNQSGLRCYNVLPFLGKLKAWIGKMRRGDLDFDFDVDDATFVAAIAGGGDGGAGGDPDDSADSDASYYEYYEYYSDAGGDGYGGSRDAAGRFGYPHANTSTPDGQYFPPAEAGGDTYIGHDGGDGDTSATSSTAEGIDEDASAGNMPANASAAAEALLGMLTGSRVASEPVALASPPPPPPPAVFDPSDLPAPLPLSASAAKRMATPLHGGPFDLITLAPLDRSSLREALTGALA